MQNGTSKAYRVRHLQALQTEDQLKVRMDVFLEPLIAGIAALACCFTSNRELSRLKNLLQRPNPPIHPKGKIPPKATGMATVIMG
jgi:hypothetical protein